MLEEATRYCALMEDDTLRGSLLTNAVITALVDLLQAGYQLAEVKPDTEDPLPSPSHEEWHEMFQRVGRRLDASYYWTIPALPFEYETPQPFIGDLGDDLVDIWGDLVTGLRSLQGGATADDVLWQWKFDFESHWGQHAVDALRLLHALKYQ